MVAYKTSDTRLLLGHSGAFVDLTPHVQGSYSLIGRTVTPRFRALTSPTGQLGLTADAMSAGMTVQAVARLATADVDLLASADDWICAIMQTTPAWGTCIPVSLGARPVSMPADGSVTMALSMVQRDAGAVSAKAVYSGSVTYVSGQIMYVIGTTGINTRTADTTVPNNGALVQGVPLVAKNS